jgi:hypothetical protein
MKVYKLSFDTASGDLCVEWHGSRRAARKGLATAKRAGNVGDGREATVERLDIPQRKADLVRFLNWSFGGMI